MDYEKMTGYEFENFVQGLFTKLGFRAQVTKASGDGGIDIIAHYEGLVFKGTYLVQCKRWKGSVGEPEIRDLYGTTISENAIKGILVTTSSFTRQAVEFARGKNIELIDGMALAQLIESLGVNQGIDGPIHTVEHSGFLGHELFDKEKYEMFDQRIKSNSKNEMIQAAMIDFIMDTVLSMGADALKNGLVNEGIARIQTYIDLFCKGKKTISIRLKMAYRHALLLFVSGKSGESYELLLNELSRGEIYYSPNYESLLFGIAVILDSDKLLAKLTMKINQVGTFSNTSSKILAYSTNKLSVPIRELPIWWSSGDNSGYFDLSFYEETFGTPITLIEEDPQRKIIQSLGLM